MAILPPPSLAAYLDSSVFQKKAMRGLPELEVVQSVQVSRRGFLCAATAALAAAHSSRAQAQLIFAPGDAQSLIESPAAVTQMPLARGQIPADFWTRPRELWMRRQGTKDEVRVVYWKDGKLQAEGYWQACALLRDVRANLMTTIDPTVLDILRGITGYYQAWAWPYPIVATSGYRTLNTNNSLGESAAKNSMHLYGKAVDMFIHGIPPRDVVALGMYLQQGGVGFYPSKGFTHLDTGKLRTWRG